MQNSSFKGLPATNSIVLPLAIKPTPGGLKIVDRAGRAIAWFYTDNDARRRSSGELLEPEEADQFAKICARALTTVLRSETEAD